MNRMIRSAWLNWKKQRTFSALSYLSAFPFFWMNSQSLTPSLTADRRRRRPQSIAIAPIETQQQDTADSSAVAAATAYYQHCWDVLMKADSLHHHHHHRHHPSDGRSPPPERSPLAMDHRHHHRLPHPPPPPPPSWMTAMAASTIPWPFIPQVRTLYT